MLAVLLLLADPPPDRRAALAHYAAGRLMAATDRPASAARELEAAAAADPAAPEPRRELVRVYADLGRDAAAIRTARAVLAADPADADTARRLGQLLRDGNQFRDAAAAFRQAADTPGRPPADRLRDWTDSAAASRQAADWPAATDAIERALAASPTDAEAGHLQEQLGAARAGANDLPGAEAALAEAGRRYAAAGDRVRAAAVGWRRAQALAAVGRPAEAVRAVEPFLALKPNTLPPYTDYADFLRAAGRGTEAASRLSELADRNPAEPRIRWVAAAETARLDAAAGERLFADLMGRSADPALATLFVRAFAAAGRFDLIVNELDKPTADDPAAGDRLRAVVAAVKAEPGLAKPLAAAAGRGAGPEAWAVVAALCERDGKAGDAEDALRRGLAAGGGADLFETLYRLLCRQRKWREAAALCRDVDGLPPGRNGRRRGPPLLAYFLATPLAELGQEEAALRAIDAAVRDAARPLLVRLEKARLLTLLGHPRLALAECDAVAADATAPAEVRTLRIQRSQAHLALRDWAASERELRLMLEDDPDDALALNNLGYHLADEGRNLAEAEVLVRRAVEIDRAERLKAGSPEAESGTYLDSLGWVKFKRGDLAGAKADLERAVTTLDAVGDPTVWDHLGDVRFRLGDPAGAAAAWRAADELYADTSAGRQFGRQQAVRRKLRLVP